MNCACCDRYVYLTNDIEAQKVKGGPIFCSIECACYSGRYSVTEGWINTDQPIKKREPKISWWSPNRLE